MTCSSLVVFFSPAVHAGSQISHSAIAINSDSGFTAANGVTAGSGIASDPFIISGWSIEYQLAPAQISVSNTRAYFVVHNVTAYGTGNGIILSNVTNGRLENLGAGGGAVSSGTGIQVTGSNNISIMGVQVSSGGTPHGTPGGGPGVIVQSSSNIIIANNSFGGSNGNVLTVDGTNVTITGNNIYLSQTGYGMSVSGTNVTVSGNAFHSSGLVFSSSVRVTADNTVNGNPLYYYHDCNSLSLNKVPVGQLIVKNCSNVQLSNLSISNTDVGIAMYGVHHALIQNVTSSSNFINNLAIDNSTDVTIEQSNFSTMPLNVFSGPGSLTAVSISGSNNTIVDGTTFMYSQRAIQLTSDVNATVSGDTFSNTNAMLCLYSSTDVRIYHNNFLISPDYAWYCLSDTQPGHFWDNGFPSGGNYWSNYTSTDPDNDGIGDTPYPIPGGVYQDRYPLMNPYPASIPLTIEFNWTPQYPAAVAGQPTTFKASAVGGVAPYSFSWNFGDGSTGSGILLTHTFASRNSGGWPVTLAVIDSASPTHTSYNARYDVFVRANPALTITEHQSPPSGLVGQMVTFTLTASGGVSPYSFSWSLGDGTKGTGPTASHSYSAPGSYYIRFNVTDSASPSNFAYTAGYYTVQNPSPVTASFTNSPSGPVVYQTVTFTASASGGAAPYSFGWNFGDGSSSSGQTATHTYLAPGKYNVTLGVTDSVASDAPFVAHQSITVNSQPTSPNYVLSWQGYDWDGGHEETIYLNGQTVTSLPATGVSSNGGAWASFSLNITSFVVPGINTLTFTHAGWDCGTVDSVRNLQVTNGNTIVYANSAIEPLSCTQKLTYLFNANPTPTPLSASFTFSPPSPSAYFTFTAQASGGFQPYTYAWDFGDGHTCACGYQVLHNYQAAGTYTVTLTVTDSASPNSQTTTVTHTVMVPPPAPPPLSAGFTFTPSNPTIGQTITFNATASGGVSPYSYSWNFGDGSSRTGATVTHAYSTAGTFGVTLTVTDSASPIDTTGVTQSVVVSAPPPPLSASFSYTPASPLVGQTITFTATASGGVPPYAFRWTFGDSTTGSVNPATHAYSAQGTYIVNLTVIDTASPASNTRTVTGSVTVSPQPPPPQLRDSFTYTPTSPAAGQIITFSANATGGVSPYSYIWNFGDGSTGIDQFTSHSYSSQGNYTVAVTVSDSESPAQTVTSTRSVVVSAPPLLRISFSYSPSKPVAGSPVTFTSSETGGVPPYSLSWNFGDGTTGVSGSAGHTYTTPGTYTVVFTVNDSGSPHNTQTTSQTITVSTPPSSSTYNLSWQGYDWDGGHEETITLNGHVVGRLPAADSPQNGGVWASFSLNITSFLVKGTNTLTLTHAGWDCSTSDNVRSLQVTSGTTLIYSNPNESPLSCTQTLTYTFTI